MVFKNIPSYIIPLISFLTLLLISNGCGKGRKDFNQVSRSSEIDLAATITSDGDVPLQIELPENSTTVNSEEEEIEEQPVEQASGSTYSNRRIRINPIGNLREVFNDSNKYHYANAERLGIRPIHSLADAYFTERPISLISSNEFFTLDTLKHSLPFLVPEAERLLNDIGKNFIDSLKSRGARGYRIRVTSLLRTPRTVKKLRRVNRNAVDSSTHQFGTTFDISFTRFHCLDSSRTINDEDLKNLLGEVLLDLRNNGRCLVKYERKGGCYHITTVK